MKDRRKLIGLIVLIALGILGVTRLMDAMNPRIAWEDHRFAYQEDLSIEANIENKINDFLNDEMKWYRTGKPLHRFRINAIEYASLQYYRVDLDIGFKDDSVGPFTKKGTPYYVWAEQYPDSIHIKEVLTGQQYVAKNLQHDTSDVIVDFNEANRKQSKIINDQLFVSNNYGTSWVNTKISAYDDSLQDLYFHDSRIGILIRESKDLVYYRSDDLGDTWKKDIFEISSPSFNHGILLIDDEKTVFMVSIDAFAGSVYNVLVHKQDTFEIISELRSNKPYHASSVISMDDVYFEDKSGEVYESHDGAHTFNLMEVPYRDEVVWGFDFNFLFTHLEVPYKEDGKLILLVNQGPNGDVKANAKAEFFSYDKGVTWEFNRYILMKDPVID